MDLQNEDVDKTSCGKSLRAFFSLELLKELFTLSWPIVLTDVAECGIYLISFLFCGHLGPLELAATILAISFTNLTGLSVATGLSTAFDTLCSQAIGAKQMKQVGVIIQRGLWIMAFACFVVWGIWLNAERIMIALAQDADAARLSAQMCDIMSIGLPSKFLYMTVQKYLQTQGIVQPILCIGLFLNVFHGAINYFFLYVLGWGLRAAALCIVISETLHFVLMLVYIKWKKLHVDTWPGWTQECLLEWGLFTKVALAGLGMICIEFCAFEIGTFIVGSINTDELGAYAVTMEIGLFLTMLPVGVSVSSSILVGQYLGSGKPDVAKHLCKLYLFLIGCLSLATVLIMFGIKDYIGYAFTDNKVIVDLTSKSMLVFILFNFFDSLQVVMGGIIRGCNLQHYGMIINFIVYNVIAIPLGSVFALVLDMKNFGFWLGLASGIILQCFCFLILLSRSNWNKLSKKARGLAGIKSIEDLLSIPPVRCADAISIARSIANIAELSKEEETESGQLCLESIPLSLLESKDDGNSSGNGETKPLRQVNGVDHSKQSKETRDETEVPRIITKKKKGIKNVKITLKLKFMRIFTMLIAVFIWVAGVFFRFYLPPIVPSQDHYGDITRGNATTNLTLSNY